MRALSRRVRSLPGPVVSRSNHSTIEDNRRTLRTGLAASWCSSSVLRKRLLVVPDLFRRMRAVEEKQIRRNARVRSEDTVGQADDRVKIEVFEQFFFDSRADAVAEERAVGHDDRGSARFRLALELAHDELEKQQCGFGGLLVFGKIAEDAALFFAAEGRVGHDDIDAVSVTDLAQREAQAVQWIDLRRFQTVQVPGSSAPADTAVTWPHRRRCSESAASGDLRPSCTASPGA